MKIKKLLPLSLMVSIFFLSDYKGFSQEIPGNKLRLYIPHRPFARNLFRPEIKYDADRISNNRFMGYSRTDRLFLDPDNNRLNIWYNGAPPQQYRQTYYSDTICLRQTRIIRPNIITPCQ